MFTRRAFSAMAFTALSPLARAQTPPPVIKVGTLKMASLTNAWVAKQAGFFERNGLNVELVEFRNGNEAVSAHQGGAVDLMLTIPGTSMSASERGFDLVMIMQNETAREKGPDVGAILVRADSPFKALKDLEGKRVALGSVKSQYSVAMEKAFALHGADPKKVNFVEIPFFSQSDVLRAGGVEAIGALDPWVTQLTSSGVARVLSWMYAESIPSQPVGAWYAKSTFLEKNGDATKRFVKAMQEAIDYMHADEARARRNVAAFTGMDPALVEKMPVNAWSYRIDKSKWQAVADMLTENGLLEKKHRADEYISDYARPYVVGP